MIYGVSEKETAHISCTVDSNPKADSFFWTLNTTAGHSEIPGAMSTDMAGASLLSYKPMSQVSCDEITRKSNISTKSPFYECISSHNTKLHFKVSINIFLSVLKDVDPFR